MKQRSQRTIARPALVSGVGFLTGANITLRFLAAPPGLATPEQLAGVDTRGRSIFRSIIDDDQFNLGIALVDDASYAFHHVLFVVVDRNNRRH